MALEKKYYSGSQVFDIIKELPDKEFLFMLNTFAKERGADVVEVVQCKDCKYATGWTTINGLYGGITCESLVDMDVDEDFFCAFGEMKEKESVK